MSDEQPPQAGQKRKAEEDPEEEEVDQNRFIQNVVVNETIHFQTF